MRLSSTIVDFYLFYDGSVDNEPFWQEVIVIIV